MEVLVKLTSTSVSDTITINNMRKTALLYKISRMCIGVTVRNRNEKKDHSHYTLTSTS